MKASQRNGKTTQAPEREGAEREGQQVLAHTHTHTHTHTDAHRLRAKIQQSSSVERKEMCLWSEIKTEAMKEGPSDSRDTVIGALHTHSHSH